MYLLCFRLQSGEVHNVAVTKESLSFFAKLFEFNDNVVWFKVTHGNGFVRPLHFGWSEFKKWKPSSFVG